MSGSALSQNIGVPFYKRAFVDDSFLNREVIVLLPTNDLCAVTLESFWTVVYID